MALAHEIGETITPGNMTRIMIQSKEKLDRIHASVSGVTKSKESEERTAQNEQRRSDKFLKLAGRLYEHQKQTDESGGLSKQLYFDDRRRNS
ncbi:hypothetical protein JTB14_011632 [Gonioctena quinquepunctata]|nr:hypothetical protein JTB14_011632 [Gonioctena quinquepunctata]